MKLLVLFSLVFSGSLAIHDYVIDSANNNFTGFKVREMSGRKHFLPLTVYNGQCRCTELTRARNIRRII